MDIATLLSWNPADLAAVGDDLNTHRRTLLDLQDEVWDGRPTDSWIGDAAEGARASHDLRRDQLNDLVAEIAPVITAIDTAATILTTAKDDVENARQTILGHGWTITNTGGSVRADPPHGAEADEGVEESVQSAVTTITEALTRADQADADLAAVLQSAKRNEYDGGSGTLSEAGLPPHLAEMSMSERVDYFLAHPEETAPYVDQLSTAEQQWLGRELSENLQQLDYGDWGYGDDFNPEEDALSDEQLALLNAQLAAFGGNSTVATTVLDEIGPETYLELQQNVLMPQGANPDAPTPATVGEAQRQLANLLAAGTSGTTGSGAGSAGDHDNVSSDWVDNLITTARDTDYNINWGPDTVNGLQLLGVAAGQPGHGTYFLNELGDTVERYEADFAAEGGWPWNQPVVGGVDARLDFTHLGADDERSWDDLAYDDRFDPDVPSGYDPMAGVMEGLSHNPDAAREFFSGEAYVPEGGEAPDNRIDYYLNDRNWDVSPYEDEWVTGMRHFGDALVTATTIDPTATSADLAEQAVSAANGTDLLPSLQNDYATILGAYMPDVYDAFGGPGSGTVSTGDADPFLPGVQDPALRANFDIDDVRSVLQEVGQNEDAGRTVTGAATLYANYGYDAVFSGALDGADLADQPADSSQTWTARQDLAIRGVNSPLADIVGTLGEGYSEQLRADGLASDEAASNAGDGYWRAGGYVANQLAGEIPFVGGVASDLVDVGVDGITGLNDVNTQNEVRADIGNHVLDTHGSFQAIAEGAVYRNLPVDFVAAQEPALVENGQLIPMDQWGQEQVDAWVRMHDTAGIGATAGNISADLNDQLTVSRSQTEDENGE